MAQEANLDELTPSGDGISPAEPETPRDLLPPEVYADQLENAKTAEDAMYAGIGWQDSQRFPQREPIEAVVSRNPHLTELVELVDQDPDQLEQMKMTAMDQANAYDNANKRASERGKVAGAFLKKGLGMREKAIGLAEKAIEFHRGGKGSPLPLNLGNVLALAEFATNNMEALDAIYVWEDIAVRFPEVWPYVRPACVLQTNKKAQRKHFAGMERNVEALLGRHPVADRRAIIEEVSHQVEFALKVLDGRLIRLSRNNSGHATAEVEFEVL